MTKAQIRRSYRKPSDNFTLKGFDGYIYVPEGKSLLKNALRGLKYRGLIRDTTGYELVSCGDVLRLAKNHKVCFELVRVFEDWDD